MDMEGRLLEKKLHDPKRRRCCSVTTVTLILFLVTNTTSILLSSGAGASFVRRYEPATVRLWDDSGALIADLNATRSALEYSRAELAGLHARLGTATLLLQTLLADTDTAARVSDEQQKEAATGWWRRELAGELKLAIGNAAVGEAALGHACGRFQDELERYMDYKPGGECPSDAALEHLLMRGGCEPLPRRRCRPLSPAGYVDPAPLPKSLWTMPSDSSVVWDAYHPCKNYSCLASRGIGFDLRGRREKGLWTRDDGALAYSVDAALARKPKGTVRIGLDISGAGSGTFAARMRERGVTVVTATTNAGAPFGSFVALRGLVPIHVGPAHRLPFFDGTLDVVHAVRELMPGWMVAGDDVALEFALFDVYRVLRPGGLFWVDHFVFPGAKLNATYAPMLDRVGFKRLRWNTGRKLDGGAEKNEWYLSALLEKRMT